MRAGDQAGQEVERTDWFPAGLRTELKISESESGFEARESELGKRDSDRPTRKRFYKLVKLYKRRSWSWYKTYKLVLQLQRTITSLQNITKPLKGDPDPV